MKFILINYEFPPLGGGSSTASHFLSKNIASLNHELKVVTTHFDNLKEIELKDGYEIIRVKALRRKIDQSNIIEMFSFIIKSIHPCIKLTKQFKPDLILAFFSIPGGLIGLILKLFLKTPYAVFLRGGDVPGFSAKNKILQIFHFFLKPVIHFICQKADKVFANSNGLRDLALKNIPKTEIQMVPNGVATDIFTPIEKNNETVKIFFIGRLTKQKGGDLLLQALSCISSQNWELEIIGDGPENETLNRLAENLGIKSKIKFTGWVNREDIIAKYQNADILVLPSSDEGMSNVILEGIACGLPVIATDISGTNELVKTGENGILIPVNNIDALKEALDNLLNNQDLRTEMGKKSRQIALEYDWKTITARLINTIIS